MHDLVHDLAQSIMEDECFSNEIESSTHISKRTCHFTSVNNQWNSYPFPKSLYQVETLRTFLVHSTGNSDAIEFSCDFSKLISFRVFGARMGRLTKLSSSISHSKHFGNSDAIEFSCDFSKLSSFRVFGARMVKLTELSSSISSLKHLRYLDLSKTQIKVLPKSICTLYDLQTLELNGCYSLRKLPKHMNRLKNLRHLYLNDCDNLSQMPPKIGEITCLKTLTQFIVGKKRDCHLAELKDLNLGGYLLIKHLQRAVNPLNAKEANLVSKRNLRRLDLYRKDDDSDHESPEDAEKVLEALEPHANLEHFYISGYKGVQFPFWMRDHILNNVVDLSLSDCHNCSHLPPLSLLASLRTLSLSRISRVMYIDDTFQGAGIIRGFPYLQNLTISDLPSLQRFSREDGRKLLPCLTSLDISKCPQLTLPRLPSVTELCVSDCNEVLLGSISNLISLTLLHVWDNNKLIYLPQCMLLNLASLNQLSIRSFSKLKCLPTELDGLSALETLDISCYTSVESSQLCQRGYNTSLALRS
ncbi:hypothetical protein LWI28_010359 [Acer negundo]|uniref:R13L1/DRL21-like LRR repeat region domain-containing protein n=1 Tax=Acer negundo TaxID=4023 RepID=A0AAD5P536_ACENE|nr:hypothetical protein LWI28_010359 [Acer negundo]